MAVSLPGIDEPIGGSWSSPYTQELPYSVEIEGHDRTQFEVKLNLDPATGNYSTDRPYERFGAELYFFIPKNLGVDGSNFSKDQFYDSILRHVRFKTPELTYADLLDPACRESPLNALHFALKTLLDGPNTRMSDEAIRQGKLLGCFASRFMRNSTRQLRRAILAKQVNLDLLDSYLDNALEILRRFRQIWPRFEAGGLITRRLAVELRWVDEYLSYRWENCLATLAAAFAKAELPSPERLAQLAADEMTHRRAHGYVCLDDESLSTREYYAYRLSALKRHITSVLYLDARLVTQNWKMISNLIAAAGAGIAAAFSGYFTIKSGMYVSVQNMMMFLGLAVVIYVLKDRIKDISKEKLMHTMKRRFPDYVRDVTDAETGETLGRIEERLGLVSKERLDATVREVRSNVHKVELDDEREETVVVYRTNAKVNQPLNGEPLRRLKLILRFNVQDYLGRLDNPLSAIRYFDAKTGAFRTDLAPKVYHLNVICRLARWDEWDRLPRTSLLRVRIVLNKDGIVRIEEILPNCPTPLVGPTMLKEASDADLAVENTLLDI